MTTLGRSGFESRIVTMNPLPCLRGWAVEKTGHKQKWQQLKRWCINRPSYSYYLIYSDNMSQFRQAGWPRTKLTTLLLQDEPLAVSRCQDEFTSGSWGRWMAEQRVWIVRRQVYKQSGQSINTYYQRLERVEKRTDDHELDASQSKHRAYGHLLFPFIEYYFG